MTVEQITRRGRGRNRPEELFPDGGAQLAPKPSGRSPEDDSTGNALVVVAPAEDDCDEDIAVVGQAEIRLYLGTHGDVCIAQIGWPDDDAIVLVRPENVPCLAIRLLKVAGYGDCEIAWRVGAFGYEDVVPGDPPSMGSQ